MLYKLYISQSSPESKLSDDEFELIFLRFQEIYKKNNVKIVGTWRNEEDPLENYLITSYDNVEHYRDFISKTKTNSEYQELSATWQASLKSTKVITLNRLPGSPIQE